ncbi:MAG: AlpA family phage regulatory protein [Syntrophaceae bacterium]|nr:AlpA family phage regulatory protein [Syntrophaceae bacterium]
MTTHKTTQGKSNEFATPKLLRLRQVLQIIPVSRSTWWSGVRDGRFPRPIKLSIGCTCWRESDVLRLVEGENSTRQTD